VPRHLLLLLALTLAGAGCSTLPRTDGEAAARPRTALVVENQSTFDMTMYVRRGAGRVRLGIARSLATTVLRIPDGVLGGSLLRFEGDPFAGRGNPLSEEISVSPGDSVYMRIPPR
jgi:hypothetical protein